MGGKYALRRNIDQQYADRRNFNDIPFDEMHICNDNFRLSDSYDNDCLQERKLIPTDSSSINYYK